MGQKKGTWKNMLACRKYSLPLSVKILHLDVCIFDFTEPSSIFCSPIMLAPSESFSELLSIDTSAKAMSAFIPKIIAAIISRSQSYQDHHQNPISAIQHW